ncbi:kinase-like domain-containing protein [Tribonema minus]|uniref:Kinase-like domain-containing protein n=1 Tax=Tribonema minus TaxID=303371 RepID=A0A835ZFF7_9STRA|nr:kinase-like domain-containing protein [Tribonema minus]
MATPSDPPGPEVVTDAAEAEAHKEHGNAAFKTGRYQEAVGHYSKAIGLCPSNHLLWSNRSMAYGAMQNWPESQAITDEQETKCTQEVLSLQRHVEIANCTPTVAAIPAMQLEGCLQDTTLQHCPLMYPTSLSCDCQDAEEAVRLSPDFVKGHFRLAKAQLECGNAEAALETARKGMSLDPEDQAGSMQQFKKLEATAAAAVEGGGGLVESTAVEASDAPKVSVRDFKTVSELGSGNFSTIYSVEHVKSGKRYAMKVIDKSEANRMKRRHPNIYNEIYMEKRALTKLHGHPGIVILHATFQDFGSLYYLLELCEGGELWSALMVGTKVVGAHPSLARFWARELVLALEHIHSKGMVHRDIKPENILLTAAGHIKIVDFGTCKDLLEPDLNGPEFVGTAQYMTPQAVASQPQGREADLWAVGCCIYQFLVGQTPFHAPSPYLCFLRIKKGTVRFPRIVPPVAVDLITVLLRKKPAARLGSDETGGYPALKAHPYFAASSSMSHSQAQHEALSHSAAAAAASASAPPPPPPPSTPEATTAAAAAQSPQPPAAAPPPPPAPPAAAAAQQQHMDCGGDGCDPFVPSPFEGPAVRVPKLSEVAVRATGDHVSEWAMNAVLVPKALPPHVDVGRLRPDAREAVRHYLHRTKALAEPRIGMTRTRTVNAAAAAAADSAAAAAAAAATCAEYEELAPLRACIDAVNRLRPRFLVVTGDFAQSEPGSADFGAEMSAFREAMARVSATVPVLYCPGNHDVGGAPTEATMAAYEQSVSTYPRRGRCMDAGDRGCHDNFNCSTFRVNFTLFGADFYSFWWGGVRGLVINTPLLAAPEGDSVRAQQQATWLEQELELAQLNAHHLMVFGHHPWFLRSVGEEPDAVVTPLPNAVRLKWLSKMGQCKVKAVFSGHLHYNLVNKVGKVAIDPKDQALGMLAPNAVGLPAEKERGDSDSDSEPDESTWVEERVEMQHITTSSVTYPLGPDPVGLRLVRVFDDRIEHEYHALSEVPESVTLEAEPRP